VIDVVMGDDHALDRAQRSIERRERIDELTEVARVAGIHNSEVPAVGD
jgi:hypothetical protein